MTFFLLFFAAIVGDCSLEQIERQIHVLEVERTQLEKASEDHLEKALRYQFSSNLYLECRREYELIRQGEDKLRLVNRKIRILEKKKEELLNNSKKTTA